MIAYLKGTLDNVSEDVIILDVNGVGYEIKVTNSVLNMITGYGEELKIYTYMSVKEDGVSLFGFCAKDELDVFKLLITVNGIGPKGAVAILSTMSVDELSYAVLADDAKSIAKTPGIGAKTASKLILELKDKFKLEDTFEHSFSNKSNAPVQSKGMTEDAILALVSLGYSNTEALRAVKQVEIKDGMNTEDILKKALTKIF